MESCVLRVLILARPGQLRGLWTLEGTHSTYPVSFLGSFSPLGTFIFGTQGISQSIDILSRSLYWASEIGHFLVERASLGLQIRPSKQKPKSLCDEGVIYGSLMWIFILAG